VAVLNQDALHLQGSGATGTGIELGWGVAGPYSGRIAYQRFSDGLDIVGAGPSLESRKITLHSQGGVLLYGSMVISGSQNRNIGNFAFYSRAANGAVWTNTALAGPVDASLYCTNRVIGTEFDATSDARIKKVKGRSDGSRDLQTLMGVKVTDYNLVDDMAPQPREYKKVIAQDLEKVFPQAVSRIRGTVPDVFRVGEAKDGLITLKQAPASPVRVGDVLKIYKELPPAPVSAAGKAAKPQSAASDAATAAPSPVIAADPTKLMSDEAPAEKTAEMPKDDVETEVTEVTKDGFRVKEKLTGNVFVYGRKVDDMRTVDYEAVAMLNVSATQELNRKLDTQAGEMKTLRADNEKLQTRLAALEARLEKIADRPTKTAATSTKKLEQ
jgi:hypothetical protein